MKHMYICLKHGNQTFHMLCSVTVSLKYYKIVEGIPDMSLYYLFLNRSISFYMNKACDSYRVSANAGPNIRLFSFIVLYIRNKVARSEHRITASSLKN